VFGLGPVNTLLASSVMAQQTAPVLRYSPPPNTYNSAAGGSADFMFSEFNASVQFYPFRPFSGDARTAFQTTLLGDWIDPMHREENVATVPTFQPVEIPGAEFALMAQFVENNMGLARPHLRLLIVAQAQAAIRQGPGSWQPGITEEK